MTNIENYLGCPTFNSHNKEWELCLDDNIKTNLSNICELALTTFNAKACRIFGIFPQSLIQLVSCGDDNIFDNEKITLLHLSNETIEKEIPSLNKDAHKNIQILSPVFPNLDSSSVYIEFYRNSDQPLTEKDKAILKLIQNNIKNHLLQQQEAIENKEFHHLISKNNKDWIFVKDTDFKIVYANESFRSLYPKDKQDKIIGYTTIEDYDPKEADIFLKNDKIAFETGESIAVEDIYMPNRSIMKVETTKRRFVNDKGDTYILGICRDITEKENLIHQLKRANDNLDDFTSIASHDLKSPLNAMKRLLEWVEEDCRDLLPKESSDNIQLAISRANRMHSLLDDLLHFAKIGRHDTQVAELSISQLFDDITPLLDFPETFTLNISDAALTVPLVPFKTVMLNIVGNAIKHHDKTNGIIDVSMQENLHYYIVKVSDNGPGIEPKYFERIFKLFQTLKSRDEIEGTGIGLCVVVKHLNILGGKIDVESDGKSGTTFNIYWPKPKLLKS